MTLLDQSVGFIQYQYNGPISPSITHLYPSSLVTHSNLIKNFQSSKLPSEEFTWMVPFYLGSIITPLVGLTKNTIIKNFLPFYYLLKKESVSEAAITILPYYFSEMQALSEKEKTETCPQALCVKILFSLLLVNLEVSEKGIDEGTLNKLIVLMRSALQEKILLDFIVAFVDVLCCVSIFLHFFRVWYRCLFFFIYRESTYGVVDAVVCHLFV